MPHVEIKCFSGRTEEQKRRCAEKVAEDKDYLYKEPGYTYDSV